MASQAPKQPVWFALLYVALSLGVEIILLVIGRLRIPADNAIIAPIVLTIPPLLAAWLTGRKRKAFWILAGLTAALTFLLTVLAGRITGIKTGLLEPIVVRFAAGAIAAFVATRLGKGPSST